MKGRLGLLISAGGALFVLGGGIGSVILGGGRAEQTLAIDEADGPSTTALATPDSAIASSPAYPKPLDPSLPPSSLSAPEPAAPSAAELADRAAIKAAYAAAPDIIWGVNGHPFTAYPNITMEAQLDTVKGLGMTHYRVNLRPDGSTYDLDQLVKLAAQRGITILPILSVDASFEKDSADMIYHKSYQIARHLAKRYAGRIKVWELGNEYENFAIIQPCEMRDDGTQYPCEWGPAGGVGPLEYYGPRWAKVSAALRGMSDGAKAGDPTVLRAMGTAGWGHLGAFDRLAADGVEWDISVWHQYQPGNDEFMKHVASFGKPIWITEFNYGGGSTDGEAAQAAGLAEMMTRHREIRAPFGVQAVFIYELFDEPYWEGYESRMGLIHLEKDSRGLWRIGPPKKAYEAVRNLIATGANGADQPWLR